MDLTDYHSRMLKRLRLYDRIGTAYLEGITTGPLAELIEQNMRVMREQRALAEKLGLPERLGVSAVLPPDKVAAALKAVDALVKPPKGLRGIGQQVLANQAQWGRMALTSGDISSLAAAQTMAQAHLSDIATASLLSWERFAHLNWESIGRVPQIDSDTAGVLRAGFVGLASSYADLYKGIELDSRVFRVLPPAATRFPAMEILREVDVVRAFTPAPEQEPPAPESKAFDQRVTTQASGAVESLLERLDPDLLTPWNGARAAVGSTNPDRGRHVCVSVRELTTHVLRKIAPDENVITWTEDPSLLHEGRPTRKARLLYVCRRVNHQPLSDFVEEDVTSHLRFLEAIQKGTHGLVSEATDEQVRALVHRAESLLLFMLRLNETEEGQ